MDTLQPEADQIAAAGADAVIIQDMAVLRLFAQRYPTIGRHASTQTAVHNADGARFLQDIGFDNIVLARELSLSEMEADCSAVSIPTEAFVHGAHCMSVSGACYLSAMLGGRTVTETLRAALPAERIAAQFLRAVAQGHVPDSAYPADGGRGVSSFKIEGRMKRPEYVAAAKNGLQARSGRETLDAEHCAPCSPAVVFSDGYLTGKRDARCSVTAPARMSANRRVLKSLAAFYRNETRWCRSICTYRCVRTKCASCYGRRKRTSRRLARRSSRPPSAGRSNRSKKSVEKRRNTFYVRSFQADIAKGIPFRRERTCCAARRSTRFWICA